jgi:hypothetical protein
MRTFRIRDKLGVNGKWSRVPLAKKYEGKWKMLG